MSAKTQTKKPTRVIHRKPAKRHDAYASLPHRISVQSMNAAINRPGLFLFTLWVIYDNLYITGAALIRRGYRFARRFRLLRLRMWNGLRHSAAESLRLLWRSISAFGKRLMAPYARVRNYYRFQQPIIAGMRQQGKSPAKVYLGGVSLVLRMVGGVLFTLFNYAAPAAALLYLLSTVNAGLDKKMALNVSYEIDGRAVDLGYVQSEKAYEEATKNVLERVIDDGGFSLTANRPIFTLQELPDDGVFLEPHQLANNIIQASGSRIEHGYGLYINDVFYGALTESAPLLNALDAIRRQSASGRPNEQLKFDKNIRLSELGLFPSNSIVGLDEVLTKLNRLEQYDEVYTVVSGDSPTLIADKLGVPFTLLKEMNPELETRGVYVGDQIYTARARPFLSVQSIFKEVYEEEYPFEVVETQNATYARGYRKVTQEGVPGLRKVTAEITTLNGIEIERRVLDTATIKEPVPEKVTVGVNNPQSIISTPATDRTPSGAVPSSTGFIWPAASGSISCYLGGYPGHTGIDIASRAGTPIYASAAGTVVTARNTNVGYGRYIVINHGNGYTTLYGHNSELYVRVGDVVAQGQVIAAMGRTGRATGNHVHFEVRYNGKVMNPVNYVGRG